VSKQDRKAPGAGAKVDCAFDAIGCGDPRRKLFSQQLANVGSWHDDALIDMKAKLAKPGFLREICRGYAFLDARV